MYLFFLLRISKLGFTLVSQFNQEFQQKTLQTPKKLWPKDYVKKYNIDNLWKYDLPNAWRLIYTIKADQITVLAVVLEWFDHKDYERRFRY